HHYLIARVELEEIVHDDLADRDLLRPSCPHHPGSRSGQDGQAVEGSLGSKLLRDADRRVRYQHDAEQRVLGCAHHEDQYEQSPEQGVERGEHVRPDDLRDGSAGGLRDLVHLATADPVADRCVVEPGEGVAHSPTVAVPDPRTSLRASAGNLLGTESPRPAVRSGTVPTILRW